MDVQGKPVELKSSIPKQPTHWACYSRKQLFESLENLLDNGYEEITVKRIRRDDDDIDFIASGHGREG